MTKISLLPEMLRADVVAGDLLPIVDVSAGATDRIKIGEIFALLPGRNRLINAQGRINQRVYVSGTATVAANQYTLDRWRVVTSGQNLTWTGNAARNIMTAPAGGVEQVIEGLNIEGGTYTINWFGTAACTVAGVARAKGEVFTLTAATDATVRFTGGTFTDVQLEPGSIPTAFERAFHGDELARCERYFRLSPSLQGAMNVANGVFTAAGFGTDMRGGAPVFTVRAGVGAIHAPGLAFYNISSVSAAAANYITVIPSTAWGANAAGQFLPGTFNADAEL